MSLLNLLTNKNYWEIISPPVGKTFVPPNFNYGTILTSENLSDPIYLALLIRFRCPEVTLPDGYTMHLMEFLAEQSLELIREIFEVFHIRDFQGSLATAIDVFYLISVSKNVPLVDRSAFSYQELIVHQYQKEKSPHLSHKSYAFWLLYRALLPEAIGRSYPFPLVERWPVLDTVRYILYLEGAEDGPIGPCEQSSGEAHLQEIDKVNLRSLVSYVVGYQRPLPIEEQKIVQLELMRYLISDLVNLVVGYLFTSPLDQWACKIGMIFPPHIISEPQRFRYYFDNLRKYRWVLSGKKAPGPLEPPESPDFRILTDSELLARLPPGEISWTDRENLECQVLSVIKGWKK